MIFIRDFVTRESLANRLTRDPKIVIHGNSCIILYILYIYVCGENIGSGVNANYEQIASNQFAHVLQNFRDTFATHGCGQHDNHSAVVRLKWIVISCLVSHTGRSSESIPHFWLSGQTNIGLSWRPRE